MDDTVQWAGLQTDFKAHLHLEGGRYRGNDLESALSPARPGTGMAEPALI